MIISVVRDEENGDFFKVLKSRETGITGKVPVNFNASLKRYQDVEGEIAYGWE